MADPTPLEAGAGRRSYYLPNAAHTRLSETADDLHFELRVSKAEALAAIIEVGLSHLDQVRQLLAPAAPAAPAEPAESVPPADS
jgi:hypothetical protein